MVKYVLLVIMLSVGSLGLADDTQLPQGDGTILFVYGDVDVMRATAETVEAKKGMAVNAGDTLITKATGRAQIRMNDGALIALKPNTEFLIEVFQLAAMGDPAIASPEREAKSFYKLIKGGFRSVTGAIARDNKSGYQVTTPVATIGIRGTDYTAYYCAPACVHPDNGQLIDGLFVEVSEGVVVIENAAGDIVLSAGESGMVSDTEAAPTPMQNEATNNNSAAANAEATTSAVEEAVRLPEIVSDDAGNPINVVEGDIDVEVSNGPLAIAVSLPDFGATYSGQNAPDRDELLITPEGQVAGFSAGTDMGDSVFTISDGEGVMGADENRDQATGLSWGRWSSGGLGVVADPSMVEVDLSQNQLHWVRGPADGVVPQLPVTGSQSFDLIGNTNPTDNAGHVGQLGSAQLDANFDNQTVDAEVNLSINNQTWQGIANGVGMDTNAARFGGDFDTVTVTDGQGVANGEGQLDGFFIGDDQGNVNGAGLGYSLSDGDGTSVEGAAAFQTAP